MMLSNQTSRCICKCIRKYINLALIKLDNEIISLIILLPSADPRRVIVSYKQKYLHEELVNSCLVKLAQEKSVAR